MNDLGSITLETDRLILRKLTVNDAEEAYNNWTSDPKTARYVTWNVHDSVDSTRKLFKLWEEEYNEPFKFRWVVYVKELKQLIGTIDLVHKSVNQKTGELGQAYGSKYWGNGYGTEALTKVLDFLLNEVGFDLIEAKHLVTNPASGRVMQKAGMQYEATLRDRFIDKETNERTDIKVYSKIRGE